MDSRCYPWAVREIDGEVVGGDPGRMVMDVVTTFALVSVMGVMVWIKLCKQREAKISADGGSGVDDRLPSNADGLPAAKDEGVDVKRPAGLGSEP